MKKNIIAVCDRDAEYACNFAEYLNSRRKIPFQAEAFTSAGTFCDYAQKNPPEILLISESEIDEKIESLGTENVVILSEQKEGKEGCKCVYKYQSAETVIQEVMEYYTRTAVPALYQEAERKLRIIGVYSPVGRCGKTLFALTAGQILGEEQSVLYINMEAYSGFEQLFEKNYEKSLTDFFYELRCRQGEQTVGLEEIISPLGKLDCLAPAASPEDIRDIRFGEWVELLETVRNTGRYQTVILDIGSSIENLFQILNLCGRVYTPSLQDMLSRCKLSQFRHLIKNWGVIEEERIREVYLPVYNPDITDGNFVETLSWGKWGAFIRKVLEDDGNKKAAGKV